MDGGLVEGGSFGNYRVLRLLGKGGMGEVWLLQSASGGLLAVKILDTAMASDHESRRRFLREAQLTLGMRHPNLVETYDVGEDPDTGLCYILMEYMPGGTLEDALNEGGVMAIEESVAVIRAMAAVLELGRQRGIVHRDIKPANIMFAADGTPKLADLGIARGDVNGADATTVTQSDVIIGTPAYMSPEQMLDAHNVDTRADIYSLGIVFFEMLTGERPNKNDTLMQLMARAVKGEPIPDVRTLRPEVSASIAKLLSMMVAQDRNVRVRTPRRIEHDLSAIVRNGDFRIDIALVRKREKAERVALRRKRRLRLQGALIAALSVLAVGGIAGIVAGIRQLTCEDGSMEPCAVDDSVRQIVSDGPADERDDDDATDDATDDEPEDIAAQDDVVVEMPDVPRPPAETREDVVLAVLPTNVPVAAFVPTNLHEIGSVRSPDAAGTTGFVAIVSMAEANQDKWGGHPPVLSEADVKKVLDNVKLKSVAFRGPVAISEVVAFFRRELGLNFVLPYELFGVNLVLVPKMANVNARTALESVCKCADFKYEVHHNIVLVMPKGEKWKWRPLPRQRAARILAEMRIQEMELPVAPANFNAVMERLVDMTSASAAGPDYSVGWSFKYYDSQLPAMDLRMVSAWDVLDLACGIASKDIEFRQDGRVIRVFPLCKQPEHEAGDEAGGKKFTKSKIRKMSDRRSGWKSMRETAATLFPGWRMCDRIRDLLPESDYKGNWHELGYYWKHEGRRDILKTLSSGDTLETDDPILISNDRELRFFVWGKVGMVVYVRDAMLGHDWNIARIPIEYDGWQEEVVVDLARFAGKRMRLTIAVNKASQEVYWSDLRIVRKGQ